MRDWPAWTPSDEMAFALALGKLWSVHLNDQNGLKFDQDKSFGSADLRSAYNQVRVLELADYAATGRFVGLDVKAMRTQKAEVAEKHLANSKAIFLRLVEKVRTFPQGCGAAVHRESRLRRTRNGRAEPPDGQVSRPRDRTSSVDEVASSSGSRDGSPIRYAVASSR